MRIEVLTSNKCVNKQVITLTGLFLQQIFFLVPILYLGRFDLRDEFRVDVVTVADVIHATAAA